MERFRQGGGDFVGEKLWDISLCGPFTCTEAYITYYRKGKLKIMNQLSLTASRLTEHTHNNTYRHQFN